MCASALSPAHQSLRIVTNETLAQEWAEVGMTWSLHPLRWEVPDGKRLTDHRVIGMEDAFVRPLKAAAPKKKTSNKKNSHAMDFLDGDPFGPAHDAAAPTASAGAGEPPNASEPVAAGLVDAASSFLDEMDMDELFFGLDLDAREAVAVEMFGHHCAPHLEDNEEEEAADEDGSDAPEGFADAGEIPPAAFEDDDEGGPPTPKPDADEFVPPPRAAR